MAILFLVSLSVPITANAIPILYEIDFYGSGSGTFTIEDSLLASIPASGTYFGPLDSVQSFSATVEGVLFDIANGTSRFAAANGQVSGVTGICCSSFSSSIDSSALLTLNTCNAIPCSTSVTISGVTTQLEYTVRRANVPESATFILLGLGLLGVGYSQRRKRYRI